MNSPLTMQQAVDFVERYKQRRERWPDEIEDQALMVVLLNYGDHQTQVACINGEWTGTKAELIGGPSDIPRCPNGHVCTESRHRQRLGLVSVDL